MEKSFQNWVFSILNNKFMLFKQLQNIRSETDLFFYIPRRKNAWLQPVTSKWMMRRRYKNVA